MSIMGIKSKQKSTMGNITTQFPGLSNSYVKAPVSGGGQAAWLGGSRGQAKGGAEGDAKPGAVALGMTEAPLQSTPDSAQADTIGKLGRTIRTAKDFVKTKGRAAKELLGG